jgi:hypothetical protein
MLPLPVPSDEIPPSSQAVQEVARRNLPSVAGEICYGF